MAIYNIDHDPVPDASSVDFDVAMSLGCMQCIVWHVELICGMCVACGADMWYVCGMWS
jgi:hypothetical protein